jgi:hypothetical protein
MAKAKQEQRHQRHQRRGATQFGRLDRDIGHVEGAEQAIKIAGCKQEQRRGDEVEKGVFDAAIELCALVAQHKQAEGGDQQHLEPDIEIEDVPGQEGAGHAGHDQQQERVETVAPAGGRRRREP